LLPIDVAGVISKCGFWKEDTISLLQGNIYFLFVKICGNALINNYLIVVATLILIRYFASPINYDP